MVVVVPSFAECDDTNNRIVAALVFRLEGLRAPNMTDAVHAPGRVMFDHDPNEAAPE